VRPLQNVNNEESIAGTALDRAYSSIIDVDPAMNDTAAPQQSLFPLQELRALLPL